MGDKVNIKQIAELAGVSVATVSRVMNQNGRFSAETEERVKKIIEEYNYIPDMVAKGLRTSRTQAIGIIVPDIVNNHFARLVLELETHFFEIGYSTMICNTNESAELEEKHFQTLISQRVVGIIVISGTHHYDFEQNIPVIYIDRRLNHYEKYKDTIVIESDNETGGYLAAKNLLDKGCKRIAVLTASRLDYNHKARFLGYQRALQEAGIQPFGELVMDLDSISYGVAKEAIKRAIGNGLVFDAVMCTTDDLAVGVVSGLREFDMRVPEDVLVTGFDDSNIAAVYNPAISSVHQYVGKMAECAVNVFQKLLDGEEQIQRYYKLPVRFIERESTFR